MIIKKRIRFFLPVEGDSEQSFVTWLQKLSDECKLHIHLDCQPLDGGGYKTMLARTIFYRTRNHKRKGKYKASILIIDSDRGEKHEDGWTIPQLIAEASKEGINIYAQTPNHEGLLLRMASNNTRSAINAANARRQLQNIWPDYKKPLDARTLASKFKLENLLQVAQNDMGLQNLLKIIGLYKN